MTPYVCFMTIARAAASILVLWWVARQVSAPCRSCTQLQLRRTHGNRLRLILFPVLSNVLSQRVVRIRGAQQGLDAVLQSIRSVHLAVSHGRQPA